MAEIDNIPEMRPSFDNIRRHDESENEYWSSRDLCAAMGYSAYWKFQKVIDKAIKVAGIKGMNIDEHFNQAVDMVRIGSGSFRKVNIFRLSRMACMIVAENANVKKVLVQQARDYFTRTISTNELMQNSLSSNILLYKTAQGEARIEVIFNSETFWMSQKRMADLFGVDVRTVNYHLGQIYETGELTKEATIRKIGIVQSEGERDVERTPLFYNLDAIIAVGYRVNSYQATQFRIWATSVLKEFIIKGYALDDERLKQGKHFGKDYFDDLLERIREIRTSERRYYQKITDIYATALDYDRTAKTTKQFFAKVQNKIVKSDVSVAKNYLSDQEMRSLELIVSTYLDLAEDRAERHIPMTMEDWAKRLDLFLMADDREVLQDAGKITAEIAKAKAETEFEKYRVVQDRLFMSDFDKYMLELEKNAKK